MSGASSTHDFIDILKPMKTALDSMINLDPSLATSSGNESHRTIDARIEGIDVQIRFAYNFTGEYTVEKNWLEGDRNETDLWELESNDVRRQVEHACGVSLSRNGRLYVRFC